jgi:hypothetical protein
MRISSEQVRCSGRFHPANSRTSVAIRQALEAVKTDFVRIVLQDQDCFADTRGTETLLSLVSLDKGVQVFRLRT